MLPRTREEMIEQNIRLGGEKPRVEKKQKNTSTRGRASGISQSRKKPIRKVSEKQAVRNGYLAGIKAERIFHSFLTQGYAECARCPKRYTEVVHAHTYLELHHLDKRSHGQGYRPGKAGVDAPSNLELLCGGRSGCHAKAERNEPEWSESA